MVLTDTKKYQLLLELSQKVRDTLDLDETMNHILDTIKTVIDYDAAGVFVLNRESIYKSQGLTRGKIAGIALRGFSKVPLDSDAMLKDGKGIVGYTIASCMSQVVSDVRQDSRYIEGFSTTLSEIAVPIMRNEQAIGALNLESNQLAAYDETDLEILSFFADAAAISIEKTMLHRQLLEKELIENQLQIAREAQLRLFPSEPPSIPGYDIAGICVPAEEIGGDYYDYIKLPQGRMGIAVADISDHGISAALMMTAFRGLLRTNTRGRLGPVKVAQNINHLFPEFSSDENFVALVYVILNPQDHEINCICCGQPPPLLFLADGNPESLRNNGPVLGVIDDPVYTSEEKSLSPGNILVLYTDGVIDITNEKGEDFGKESLSSIVNQSRELPAAEIIQRIIQAAHQFSGLQNFEDDFTLVVIKRQ